MNHKNSRRNFLKKSLIAGTALACGNPCTANAESKNDAYQIGCFTRPWDQFDYRKAFDAIAEAGFKHVGLMTCNSKNRLILSVDATLEDAQKVGEEVKKRGLQVPCTYGGGIPVEKSLQAGIDELKKLIDKCALAGSKSLMMGGTGNKELFERYYKAIAECCDYAMEKKVGVALKPHGGLNATGPQCRKTIESVGHKNFTLWYDPGNIFYYSNGELDPIADAPNVDGIVTGLCVKDYKHPKEVLVNPGDGQVNFKKVFSLLKKGGFKTGPLVIETLARGSEKELLTSAKKAKKFIEEFIG